MRTSVVGAALLGVGLVALLTGVLPVPAAVALADRVWPVLAFVVAMTVVTELAAQAGLFRAVGEVVTRRARGRSRWSRCGSRTPGHCSCPSRT